MHSPRNRDFVRDLDEWSRVLGPALDMELRHLFLAVFHAGFPRQPGRAENTIRLFAEHGVKGVFQQDNYTTPNANSNGLSGYL